MRKLTIFLLPVFFIGSLLQAQTIEQGREFLYYDRFTSAKNNFESLIDNNPGNADAIYWLGQTFLRQDSLQAAKSIYERALAQGVNAPILQVGLGHIQLLEGKNDSAKQKFEAAIESTKKRKKENPDILNAIGRANADGPSTTGEPAYAIEKLLRAVSLKPNDPEIFVNLGINYLKLGPEYGGKAYSAFQDALNIDPNYALAKYRLGKIFATQSNPEKYLGYYNGAIESDSMFSPAYLELYTYYANRDVNKAQQYLEGYMSNSDKDCQVNFFYADYLFRAGKYQESLDKAKELQNGECKNLPRLKVLMAYNYDRMGDSIRAQENIQSFLSTAATGKIETADYVFAADVYKKTDSGKAQAINYLQLALEKDTLLKNRIMYMDSIAFLYRKLDNPSERLNWLVKSYQANPAPSNFDIYNMGDAALDAGNFQLADSMFSLYKTKFPDQVYGYAGLARAAIAADKDTTAGTAVQAVKDYIRFLETRDIKKYKSTIIRNYGYLVYVHANITKDYEAALEDLEGILKVDPENAYAKSTAAAIRRIMEKNDKS
jgi:tetratricopeptide (TPR) repeat protein